MEHKFKKIKKILVIKLRHIGDVLLTVPVFRALKENFHNAGISALVNSGTEEVLTGNPLISEIIIFNRNIKKMNPLSKYNEELLFLKKIRKKGFDMVVDLTSGDRSAVLSFTTGAKYRLAYAPYRKGFPGKKYLYTHLAKKKYHGHTVLMNLDIVRQFGIDTGNLDIDLSVEEKDISFAKKVFRENNIKAKDKVIHIHPVSRLLYKCWKDEYMAEVINWIIGQNIRVVVTSSSEKQELEKTKKIMSLCSSSATCSLIPGACLANGGRNNGPRTKPKGHSSLFLDLCGKTSIKELAAISKTSFLFFGIDSAPMHIAAAVGTPVIALFGSGEKRWSPWGSNHLVISKITGKRDEKSKKEYTRKNLEQIKPEDVIIELKKRIYG